MEEGHSDPLGKRENGVWSGSVGTMNREMSLFRAVKMETASSSKTSISAYKTTRRHKTTV
jgi:hypothetical protein